MKLFISRGVTPRVHGAVDYAACAAMLLLPGRLGLSAPAKKASQAFALSYLGITLLTDFPPAVKRLIPFPVHGQIELLSAPLLLLTPKLLHQQAGKSEHSYFQGLTLLVLTAYLSTDWHANPDE